MIFKKPKLARPKNPYVTGNSVGGEGSFIGRRDIILAVENMLASQQNNAITLFGQRRIGKTSVLKELEAKLPHRGAYQPIYFDLMGKAHQSLDDILSSLAETICYQLKCNNQWQNTEPFKDWIEKLLKNELAQKSLIFLFDEFDALNDSQAEKMRNEFFDYLQKLLLINPQQLNVVFAIGRNIDDFTSALVLLKNHNSQRVSLLEERETEHLIKLSARNKSLYWSTTAIRKIKNITNGHPLLTQLLCDCIWRSLWDQEPNRTPRVTPQVVEQNIREALNRELGQASLQWIWEGLPAACKIDAAAFAEFESDYVPHKKLISHLQESGIAVDINELETAPTTLKEWDIIERNQKGYRFRVEFFRQWIKSHKPLKEIMGEELRRIRVEAEAHYQAAQSFYQQQNFEAAIEKLEAAVRINPHFVIAYQLLADILINKGDIDKAQMELKKFYQCCPEMARARLIEVLWMQVSAPNTRKSKQLELCEQILQYDPEHRDAKRRRRDILQRQGQNFEEEGKYKEAIEVYRKAESVEKVRELWGKFLWVKYGKLITAFVVAIVVFGISWLLKDLELLRSIPWYVWGGLVSVLSFIIVLLNRFSLPLFGKKKRIKRI